jgi:hypothetical protein
MFLWVSLFTPPCLSSSGGPPLSAADKGALVAFLKTLTDPQYLTD